MRGWASKWVTNVDTSGGSCVFEVGSNYYSINMEVETIMLEKPNSKICFNRT